MSEDFKKIYDATIKKEFYKNNIKYLELQYTDEETDKIYLIKISYKRYILQKYLGYLIPKEHRVISLDGNEENYDVYNLGIRDEDNESPVYKGWKIISSRIKGKHKIKQLVLKKDNIKRIYYQRYVYAVYLGRELFNNEVVILKNKDDLNFNITNLSIYRLSDCNTIIPSTVYPNKTIKGIYKAAKHLRVYIVEDKKFISYQRFLYQEYLGRKLTSDEYVSLKVPNIYDLKNLELKTVNILHSKLYPDHFHLTGPHIQSFQKRQYVRIRSKDKRFTISYPKFLMQEHLGRLLVDDETVHHIDGDYYNNDISNLKVLKFIDHVNLDMVKLKSFTITCQVCGKVFLLEGRKLSGAYKNLELYNSTGPYCSKSCGSKVHLGNKHLFKNLLKPKEYYNNSNTFILKEI